MEILSISTALFLTAAFFQRKGSATKPISQTQKQRNRRIATPLARVEHTFGAMRHM